MAYKNKILSALLGLCCTLGVSAQEKIEGFAGVLGNASSGDFAPYFIGSLNGGRTARASSVLLDVGAKVEIDKSKRFSWGAGAEVLGGYSSANEYDHWNENLQQWSTISNHPSALWIQQLYGELKYRGVFLRVGQKDYQSALLDESLSSGDLTRSSNARGIPGVEVGFVDFQNIPFTNGWVQIQGVIEYGRYMDNGFKQEQFNHYNYATTKDLNHTYKRCYFRTNPNQPFSVTVGMQTAGQFGGTWERYHQGKITSREVRGFKVKDIFNMFFPIQGASSDGFYEGNSLGSWDFKARYSLKSGEELSFVFQWPWEDGSGIGRRNGFDGLWGLYYHKNERSIISGAALEYLDFTNQCGPIHWAPNDHPGTSIGSEATGGDDYYNNEAYGSYSNYGMAIGTPFLVSPLYNLDGFSGFAHNRARGVHAAVKGCIGDDWDYSVKYSWQQAWGTGRVPQTHSIVGNSMMVSANWNAKNLLPGLKINAKLAFDAGSLRGDNLGALVGITYNFDYAFKKDKK